MATLQPNNRQQLKIIRQIENRIIELEKVMDESQEELQELKYLIKLINGDSN